MSGQVAASAAIKVCNTLLGLLVAATLARMLGAEGFGIYSYAFVIVSVLSVVIQFGVPRLVIRETARACVDEDWPRMRRAWRWAVQMTLGTSVAIGGVAGLALWSISGELNALQTDTLGIAFLLMPLMALGALRGAALRGLGHVIVGQLPEFVLRPLALLVLLGIAVLAGHALTPDRAMTMHVLAAALALTVGWVLLWRRVPKAARGVRSSGDAAPGWWSASFAMAISAGMNQLNNYADILVIGWYWPAEDVGLYRVAYQSSNLVAFGLQAVGMVAAPQFARLYRQSDMAGLQAYAVLTARMAMLVAVPVAVVFFVHGERLLELVFGAEFSGGYMPLVILAAGQVVNAFFGTIGMLLNMTGCERNMATVMTIAAVQNVCLNLILVPLYGLNGAAFATFATLLTWNVCLWVIARRRLGINAQPFVSSRVSAAAGGRQK